MIRALEAAIATAAAVGAVLSARMAGQAWSSPGAVIPDRRIGRAGEQRGDGR